MVPATARGSCLAAAPPLGTNDHKRPRDSVCPPEKHPSLLPGRARPTRRGMQRIVDAAVHQTRRTPSPGTP